MYGSLKIPPSACSRLDFRTNILVARSGKYVRLRIDGLHECREAFSVPLVVMRHGLAAPGLDRQPGLGAVERLDLAFFIDRQHHRMGRRIDVEPNNISELVGKL